MAYDPVYQANHVAVRKLRGKASDQDCVDCGSQARDWSQVTGTDGTDPEEHFRPRCRSCHVKYDDSPGRAMAGRKSKGLKRTPEQKQRLSEAHMGWKKSVCDNGHDISKPEQRKKNGHECRECANIRTRISRNRRSSMG